MFVLKISALGGHMRNGALPIIFFFATHSTNQLNVSAAS